VFVALAIVGTFAWSISPAQARRAVATAEARQPGQPGAQTPAAPALTIIPFELHENLVYLPVSVNGSRPLWFVLDSGASASVIDRAQAKALGIKSEGAAKGKGAGAGTYDYTFAKNISYALPGVAGYTAASSFVIDLSGVPFDSGVEVSGLLGSDFFTRYVVEIDYDAQMLRLYEPQTYVYQGGGQGLPLTIKGKKPYVSARMKPYGLDEVEREFLLDTGSADAINDDTLAQSTAPKMEVTGGYGLGQQFKIFLMRVERLRLGDYALADVNGDAAAGATTGGVGTTKLGAEVLHRFTVTFDYSRQRLYLEPNRHYKDEFVFDASGAALSLAPDHKSFIVAGVFKGGAAADAGLREGDLITAIDGRPAENLILGNVRRMFHGGQAYRLSVRRGGKQMQVNLKLRKLL
jgi:hypothetical protein